MEPLNWVSTSALIVSSLVAIYSISKMYFEVKRADKFKITRKDTGQSIVISRNATKNERRRLLELVD